MLLVTVIAQVDIAQAQAMLESISGPALLLAFFCLLAEGVITALRIWLFAARKPCLSEALRANAWYVLLLVMLPARLGEVAAVLVFEKFLKQKYGAAAMSIITQRLYDVVVLGVLFLIALLGMGDFINAKLMMGISLGLIALAGLVLIKLEMFLTWAALLLRKFKPLFRLILQARAYSRHILKPRDIVPALLLTLGKWLSNLGALVFLLAAVHLGLNTFESVTVAAAYNFLAIIPLQTIGGIGIGEAGLTALLAAIGIDVSEAAAASLMVRFVILIFPFIFWVGVMGGLKIKERICK